jgi:hypothetical protein
LASKKLFWRGSGDIRSELAGDLAEEEEWVRKEKGNKSR